MDYGSLKFRNIVKPIHAEPFALVQIQELETLGYTATLKALWVSPGVCKGDFEKHRRGSG